MIRLLEYTESKVNVQKSKSDEDELPLHETASSIGLRTSLPESVSFFFPAAEEPVVAVAEDLFLDTPNWNGASVIWILLGV